MADDTLDIWRHVIGAGKSWVLFSHGTCVVLTGPQGDPVEQATELMKEWGPVVAGTSAGDFNVFEIEGYAGSIVTSHHPNIFTYVGPEEAGEPRPDDMIVGLIGRSKRHQDAEELQVVHVEDVAANGGSQASPASG